MSVKLNRPEGTVGPRFTCQSGGGGLRGIGIEREYAVVHRRDINDVVLDSADGDAVHIQRLRVHLPIDGESADLPKVVPVDLGREAGLLQIGARLVGVVVDVQHIHLPACDGSDTQC